MMMPILLLAITASVAPCEPVVQKPVSELPAELTRRALIRFAPSEDQAVTVYRVGRGDALVELATTDNESDQRHVRVGTRQAEIDGELGEAISRMNANDCRAGRIVTTLTKLTRRELDRKTAEKELLATLGQQPVIGPAPNATP